ncbi:YgaP-like transmembrane domain [Bradyrhizobium sp. SRS-191]
MIAFSGAAAWWVAADGVAFALTGIVGYCPACAVAEIGQRFRTDRGFGAG